MSLNVTVINKATSQLQGMEHAVADGEAIHLAMAHSAEIRIKDHFAANAQRNRNPYGARSTFWKRMRGSVRSYATSTTGTVAMGAEVGLRYHGGTIRPTGGRRALTIPVNAAAYGKRAREFSNLVLIKTGSGAHANAVLAMKSPTGPNRLTIYFLLVSKVTIKPDTSVLPSPEQLQAAAAEGASDYMERFTR